MSGKNQLSRTIPVCGAAPKVNLSYIRFFYQIIAPIAGSDGSAILHEFAKYANWGLLIQRHSIQNDFRNLKDFGNLSPPATVKNLMFLL